MPDSQAGVAGVYQTSVTLHLGAQNALLWSHEENRVEPVDFFSRLSLLNLLLSFLKLPSYTILQHHSVSCSVLSPWIPGWDSRVNQCIG